MRRVATILLLAGVLGLAAALVIALTGGVALRTPRFTLRDPIRPLVAGLVLLVAARLAAGREFATIARPYVGSPEQLPSRIAALASACVLVFAIAWTSRAAGGSDSSCYVLQAEAFAGGHATLDNPVARVLPDAPNAVFAPIGFLPSRSRYGAAVPICAPGLALAMAAAYLVHPSAVFLVVPVAAALLVWLTFVYGRRVDDDVTGACAAVLLACSPIFLYQAVQPMSDVPAAAAWLAALVATSPVAAGVSASIAILIRPNLALLTVPLVIFRLKADTTREGGAASAFGREFGPGPVVSAFRRNSAVSVFLLCLVPGVATLLALNVARYGGVFATGYGDAGTLFSLDRVGQNLARYAAWILETQTPFVLLAIAGPWALRRDRERQRFAWISLLATALLAATYLAYTVFDDWWYLRFLLPALPIVLALGVAVLRSLAAQRPGGRSGAAGRSDRVPTLAAIAICAALAGWYVRVARERHVTDLQRLESRFVAAGEFAARNLPANAVVLAVQQSGAIRFHGRRDTIAWDAIPPDALDAAIAVLRRNGRSVYLALEDTEDQRFRARFSSQRAGALDWRPIAELRAPARVRFYEAPADTSR